MSHPTDTTNHQPALAASPAPLAAWAGLSHDLTRRAPDRAALNTVCRAICEQHGLAYAAILVRDRLPSQANTSGSPTDQPSGTAHTRAAYPVPGDSTMLPVEAIHNLGAKPRQTVPGDLPAPLAGRGLPPDAVNWQHALLVPLSVEDMTVGLLILAGDVEFSPLFLTGTDLFAGQLALLLVNDAMRRSMERRAGYEQALGEITASLQQQGDVKDLLHEALIGLGRALGASQARARLQVESSPPDRQPPNANRTPGQG